MKGTGLKEEYLFILNKSERFFANRKVHFLLFVIGFTTYFGVCYSPLNPFGGPTSLVPVPLINGVWGATIFLSVCLVVGTGILFAFKFGIAAESVELLHEDEVGGYKEVMVAFTRILEVFMFGLGFFFVSIYYFVNSLGLIITLFVGLSLILSLYFFVAYKIHLVLLNSLKLEKRKRHKKLKTVEEELLSAVNQNDTTRLPLVWFSWQYFKESLGALDRMKTWPLDIPNIGRITAAALASFLFQCFLEFMLTRTVRLPF
jgi:hypothetical protein